MKDIIEKISIEQSELDNKLDKLNDFISSDKFNEIEEEQQNLLLAQQGTMARYLCILRDRLNLLNKGK